MKSIGELRQRLRVMRSSVRDFMRNRLWDVNLAHAPGLQALGIRILRAIVIVFKGFKEDECSIHASALTFSSLMSIVPVLALCLSMAQGLGVGEAAEQWVKRQVRDWTDTFKTSESVLAAVGVDNVPEVAATNVVDEGLTLAADESDQAFDSEALAVRINELVEKGFEQVEAINFATLGTVGLLLLIWMVIEVLGRVERSFNRVWGVTHGRSFWRRFTDYISVLLILPVLMVAAASLPVVDVVISHMPGQSAVMLERLVASEFYRNLVVLVLTTMAFTFLIIFMPNTSMRFSSGLAGGLVTALLFLAWLWICAMLQVGAARYGRIYGSFALAPIVLAWVHVSWQIILFGAEVAFATENCSTYEMERNANEASMKARLTLALMIMAVAARDMLKGEGGFRVEQFVGRYRISVRLVKSVLEMLVGAGYLAPVANRHEEYALLRSPESLTATEVLQYMLNAGNDEVLVGIEPAEAGPAVCRMVDAFMTRAESPETRLAELAQGI